MKKIFLIAVLVFNGITLQAQELNWLLDAKKAAEISMKEDKPMLMFFTGSDWCGWCKRLVKNVYSKKEFKDWANTKVVLSMLDFPSNNQQTQAIQSQNAYLKNLLKIGGFPTVVIVKPKINENGSINLNEIGRLGYAENEKIWLTNAELILDKLNKQKVTD